MTLQYTLIGSRSITELGLAAAADDILMLDTEPVGENMSFLGKTSPIDMSKLSSPARDIFGARAGYCVTNNPTWVFS